jgi:hypothetical protein
VDGTGGQDFEVCIGRALDFLCLTAVKPSASLVSRRVATSTSSKGSASPLISPNSSVSMAEPVIDS